MSIFIRPADCESNGYNHGRKQVAGKGRERSSVSGGHASTEEREGRGGERSLSEREASVYDFMLRRKKRLRLERVSECVRVCVCECVCV